MLADNLINEFIKPFRDDVHVNESKGGAERRLYVRKDVSWNAVVDNFIEAKECVVTNVSEKGARIISETDLGIGAHVELKIMANINNEDVVISTVGETRHIAIGDDIYIGIEFIKLDEFATASLAAFTSN
jgi:hypothetical protein